MLWSRFVAVIALGVLAPVGLVAPALAPAHYAAALVVVLLAAWDSVAYRKKARAARGHRVNLLFAQVPK